MPSSWHLGVLYSDIQSWIEGKLQLLTFGMQVKRGKKVTQLANGKVVETAYLKPLEVMWS